MANVKPKGTAVHTTCRASWSCSLVLAVNSRNLVFGLQPTSLGIWDLVEYWTSGTWERGMFRGMSNVGPGLGVEKHREFMDPLVFSTGQWPPMRSNPA